MKCWKATVYLSKLFEEFPKLILNWDKKKGFVNQPRVKLSCALYYSLAAGEVLKEEKAGAIGWVGGPGYGASKEDSWRVLLWVSTGKVGFEGVRELEEKSPVEVVRESLHLWHKSPWPLR